MGAIHVHEFMTLDGVIDAPIWSLLRIPARARRRSEAVRRRSFAEKNEPGVE